MTQQIHPSNPLETSLPTSALSGIADALYRFAAGQDLRDRALLATAFTEDAVLDFSHPASCFGVDLAPFSGRDTLVETVFATTEPLITTHTVSNVRVTGAHSTGTSAYALVEAQHVVRNAPEQRLKLKNHYFLDAVCVDGLWQLRRMRIEMAWHEGDKSVLFG